MPEQASIYLDWNATAPPHPDVIAAMQRALESAWANPASVHAMGRNARAQVENAREAVAALTGFHPRDVLLTSGGTEANNLALFSVMTAWVAARLAVAINLFLEPFRERRAHYQAHPLVVQDILAQGIRRMQAEARETMRLVRDATGLSYSAELFQDTIDLFGTE